jgi:hypothetical protein
LLKAESTCLLIADISGYTSYLGGVELDHAQDIIADLLGTVISSLRPAFRLAKLEGDAAFTLSPAETVDGSLLLDVIERCYFTFRRRRRDVRQATSCDCNACVRIPTLDLKFVAHQGTVMRQRIAGREELMGSDVIAVHRMLKNDVVEATGIHAYALFSQPCIDAMGVQPESLAMRPHAAEYEGIGVISAWVHDLERRWTEEEQRERVFVGPDDAIWHISKATTAPPQVAWEFLTTPGRRAGWQQGVTAVEMVSAPGNRRGVGATNHCMHGKDAIIEEILDWRPYDYLTDRSTMPTPAGKIRFLSTIEIEPTADGSTVHMRVAPPLSARERAIFARMGPMFEELMTRSYEEMARGMERELSRRDAADDQSVTAAPTAGQVGSSSVGA